MNKITKAYKEKLDKEQYESIVNDIVTNEMVLEMKKYRQHYETSTYEHCKHVSYLSYKIAKKFNLDYISLARAAMLHDLFLYDWRKKQRDVAIKGLHAMAHPKIAYLNAIKQFKLNDKEKDIILKHMWPVTLKLPKYKESYIITFTDKYCAIMESVTYYIKLFRAKRIYQYINAAAFFITAFINK